MLLLRYFGFVGGVLVALLFAADAYAPKSEVASVTDGVDRSVIRIHSDRKWPERVVFDTSAPTLTVAPAVQAEASVPAPANVAGILPTARVRETFAQFVPAEPKKAPPKARVATRVAKSRAAPMRFAQHERYDQRFGPMANNIW
jgi:hypothetical protein